MTPQIYIMAAITLMVALALWGGLVYLFTGHQKRYFWLLLLGLPLSAVANLLLKPQAIIAVGRAAHVQPGLGLAAPVWFLAYQVMVTPLVEEAIKILPLLLIPARKMITDRASAFWVGFVLGIGFGLGEAAFTAYAIAQGSQYASLPWYAFTGYLNDRLLACFGHGVFTAVLVTGLQRGGRFIPLGYLAAVGLHFLLNLPIVLYQVQWISIEVESFGIVIPLIVVAIVFESLRRTFSAAGGQQAGREVTYFQR